MTKYSKYPHLLLVIFKPSWTTLNKLPFNFRHRYSYLLRKITLALSVCRQRQKKNLSTFDLFNHLK